MKNPEHAQRVLYVGMGSITILYAVFGLLGYLAYGSNIQDSITLNLATSRPGACAYVTFYYEMCYISTVTYTLVCD